ncbi:MAG TPA: NnrS family protein, partial [Aquabacterium sp.]|nr:NnrS family protein [Aquabacterium sp.]
LASVHALTMGFMGSVWLAMVSRVSSTHAGRSIAADQITWGLFWAMQLATGLRVAAALLPTMQQSLWVAAASLWLGVVGAWAWRHARWWGRA